MLQSSDKFVLDEQDIRLLEALQENATMTNLELAEHIGMSPSATHTRVRRLEEGGYIDKRLTVLNRERLGFDMLCLIHVRLQTHQIAQIEDFYKTVRESSQVLECYHVTGEYDYVLKVALRNRVELRTFVLEQLTPIPFVATVQTSIVFEEVKFTTALPLS